jgi:NAD(P)H-flavin reductase
MPVSAPLYIRRVLCKVYEYGGIHSGAAICSVIWFILFTAIFTRDFVLSPSSRIKFPAILVTTYILLVFLLMLVTTAYPKFRMTSHNTFENFHRWGGWFSLALFWVELLLFAHTQSPFSLGKALSKFPAFWFLLISTIHTILPWFRLHKPHVVPEKYSDHAIRLHFTEKIPLFAGLRISASPLREWHSFACIPVREGRGGSLLISDAGDWTRETIQNPKPYYWVKGIPVTGVLPMARLFKKVIVVTTGSGIGPCLGVIQDVPLIGTKIRVVWSTPSPLETYGWEICEAVKKVDVQAVIIDTRKMKKEGMGRPNLTKIAWDLYRREEAEAVFVISNPQVTRKVVYGLESRGVPAFGPIWGS